VDIYSSKFALIIMIVLVVILVLQVMSKDNNNHKIDFETCELYIEDSQFGGKKYLNEFDSKCLELKNLNP
jgi:energy-converting hydrogenase Eha subunit H